MSHATTQRQPAVIDRAAVDRAKARLVEILSREPDGLSISRLSQRLRRRTALAAVRDAAIAELAGAGAVEVRTVPPHPLAGGVPATVVCLPGAPDHQPPPPRRPARDAPADPEVVAAVRAESMGVKAGQLGVKSGKIKQRFFRSPHPTRWDELSHAAASREIRRMFRRKDPRLFADRFGSRPGDDHAGPGKHDRGGVLP